MHKSCLAIGLILIVLTLPIFAATVMRDFNNSTSILTGGDLAVKLIVDVNNSETYYAIEETPPSNWIVKDTGTGFLGIDKRIRWAVIDSAIDINYNYILKAPTRGEIATFYGEYMAEGMPLSKEIGGQNQVIVNESVVLEDSQASITVTPHTAYSLDGNYEQTFEACNKTGTDATLFGAFVFNFDLNSGSVRYWRKPVYDWVSNSRSCDYNYNYKLNEDADRNPHRIWCFQTLHDVNGYDANIVFWTQEFKTWSVPTKTIYWDVNELISGNNWLDVTQKFTEDKFTHNGKQVYPYLDGLLVKANSCETWEINYVPSINDNTKKWEAWLWAGSSWNCILTDTCTKTLKLDPWWSEGGWGYRKKITLATSNYLSGNITNDHVIYVKQTAADTDFWNHVQSDGRDVRFAAADGSTELKFYFQRFDDGNQLMDAWVKVTDTFTSDSNVDIYMYYGNAGASDAQDAANTLTNYLAVYHSDEGTGTTVSDKIGTYSATATDSAIWDTSTQKLGTAGLNPAGSYTASNATFLDTPPANLSFSFWFNPAVAAYKLLISKENDAPHYNFIEVTYNPTSNFRYNLAYDGTDWVLITEATYPVGTWYHVITTWNTSGGAILFVDGVVGVQDGTLKTVMEAGTRYNFTIGGYGGGGTIINGKMDEVKVMNVGIDTNEAMLLYHSENGDLQTYGAEEGENTTPYMASIDLNATYAKQNDDIKVTASGVGDAESNNITLLCGTLANPTIDTNDFCTDFGNASPYSDVSCVGKGASGDGTKTIYCRMWDGTAYSIDQNTDTYTADNTNPSISGTIINGGNALEGINYDLNMTITESGSGLATTTYKCWSLNSSEESCTSASWDCKTGNLIDNGSDNYGAGITGSIKDTNETWTCKAYATDNVGLQGTGTDIETMNETTGITIDSSSITYDGVKGSTCNAATTNQTNPYVLITHNGNIDLNILNLCGDLNYLSYTLPKINHKWYLSNNCGSATSCTGENQELNSLWGKGTYPTAATMNEYYWLDIPVAQQIGNYTGTITIGATKSG